MEQWCDMYAIVVGDTHRAFGPLDRHPHVRCGSMPCGHHMLHAAYLLGSEHSLAAEYKGTRERQRS